MARTRFLDIFTNESSINRGIYQGFPLSPHIIFSLLTNDVLDSCDKYGVSIGGEHCCRGLFGDDDVLILPIAKKASNTTPSCSLLT